MNEDLLRYFMQKTNERFDKIDTKLDRVVSFQLMLIGGSLAVGAIAGFALKILVP